MSDLDRTFAALSDRTRRSVVELLHERPHRAGELARALRTSAPAMSRHLRVLRESGLVREAHPEEDARVRVFTLQPEPFGALRAWIEEVETFWEDELASFKAHAERTRGPNAKKPRRKRS